MFRSMICGAMIAAMCGCVDNSPPPPRVGVPRDPGEGLVRQREPQKPMPGVGSSDPTQPPPPAFDDVPLVDQEMPEKRAFIEAYNAVGRPTIIVEGVHQSDLNINPGDRAVALVFADWMRCDGAVTMVTARGDRAQPDVVIELVINGEGDRPAVNMSARASNARDNVLLGQAMVDMPKPTDRGGINRYTRFLARKLMSDMTRSWANLPPARPVETQTTQPSR